LLQFIYIAEYNRLRKISEVQAGPFDYCVKGVIYSLKFVIKRERPLFFLEMSSKLSKGPGEILDPSFPSAHAAYSFMMATLLATWFPRYRVLFFILAGFIGWTRIYLGLHYPIDVIAGGILGYGITKLFLHWVSKLEIKIHQSSKSF